MKNFWLLISVFLFIVSCGDVGKILRNEKIKTTDEFLVKKKGPLVLPPNYEEIPKPDTIKKKTENNQNKIKSILKTPKKEKKKSINSSSIEKSILEKINK
jgi:predicted small lipoprotein YifL